MSSSTITGGAPAFETATDAFIAALRDQLAVDVTMFAPPEPSTPPRGVRQWSNLMVKTWRFLGRWRTNIMGDAPPSVQAIIVAVDVVIELIAALNPVGPE